MRRLLAVALQWAALAAINRLGYAAVATFHVPLPGNLVGMLLLLALLSTGAVPARWLAPGAPFLTRHLAFFFVPITVGLMGFGALFRAHGVAILAVLVSSAAVGICGAGLTSEALEHRRRAAEVTT